MCEPYFNSYLDKKYVKTFKMCMLKVEIWIMLGYLLEQNYWHLKSTTVAMWLPWKRGSLSFEILSQLFMN